VETITISKGDYGFYLSFTVNDSDDEAYDLTDYTITLKVWAPGKPETLLIDSACSPVVAASGTCRYLVQEENFDTKGRYVGELELTEEGVIESTEPFVIVVKESG